MRQVENGNSIKIHFTGKFENGEIFDTSLDGQPMAFRVGKGDVMPGLEEGVVGMVVGDTKTIEILPHKGFGDRRPDLIVEILKRLLPDTMKPEIGQQLQVSHSGGEAIIVTIIDQTEDTVTLDGNHPLAGQTLLFDVELVEIS